jgi:hypothetical protein
MRKLLLSATLLLACSPGPVPRKTFSIVETDKPCYLTSQNVAVYHEVTAKCPPQKALNVEEDILFRRVAQATGLPNGALDGQLKDHRVIVTNSIVDCDVQTTGCTSGFGDVSLIQWKTMLVLVEKDRASEEETYAISPYQSYRHELGHQLRMSMGKDIDPEHRDCRFWHAVDGRWPRGCWSW